MKGSDVKKIKTKKRVNSVKKEKPQYLVEVEHQLHMHFNQDLDALSETANGRDELSQDNFEARGKKPWKKFAQVILNPSSRERFREVLDRVTSIHELNARHSPGDPGAEDATNGKTARKAHTLGAKNVRVKRSVDMFRINEAARKVGEQIALDNDKTTPDPTQSLSFALQPLEVPTRGRSKGQSKPKRVVSARF